MGSSASEYFEIPKFFVFSQKGVFAGSASERDFNYKVVPDCPKEGEKSLKAYIWSGENCMNNSENVEMRSFPLSEEGHAEMLSWLESEYLSRDTIKLKHERQLEYARELCSKYVSPEDFFNAQKKE